MMLDPKDLEITSYRSNPSFIGTGPSGGMYTGLINSGIFIKHIPSSIGVVCDSERSQHKNKEKALAMLEILLEVC